MMMMIHIYSSGNKFVVFCRVAATLQNTTNLFPLLYDLFWIVSLVTLHKFECINLKLLIDYFDLQFDLIDLR